MSTIVMIGCREHSSLLPTEQATPPETHTRSLKRGAEKYPGTVRLYCHDRTPQLYPRNLRTVVAWPSKVRVMLLAALL
ncbi:hypothetical protein JOB18_015984 [Solea senegalensis]|uniref:Uncharacterized protein n=1 Tax=Solea senegalensis TaxID=28829 RepID=A0AAV6R5U8_SOLSE|nr:hypothetical protein JOB18_015984 [Solea senegalensis]